MKAKRICSLLLSFLLLIGLFPSGILALGEEIEVTCDVERTSYSTIYRVYANGLPLILKEGTAGSSYTVIYVDQDNDGVVTDSDIWAPDGLNATAQGNRLMNDCYIYGGSKEDEVAGDTSVVMEGGRVTSVYGGSRNGTVTGSTSVTIAGGTVTGSVYGAGTNASSHVAQNTSVTVTGGTMAWVYGGGYDGTVGGNTSVSVSGGKVGNFICGGSSGTQAGTTGGIGGSTSVSLSGTAEVLGVSGGSYYSGDIKGDVAISITGGTILQEYGLPYDGVVFGAGYEGKVMGNVEIRMTEGNVVNNIYGTSYRSSASVGGDVSVEITGGTVGAFVYARGAGTVAGTVSLTVGGAAKIGTTERGVQINGISYPTTGVEHFQVSPDLSKDAQVYICLPSGYQANNAPIIATEGVQADIGQMLLTGSVPAGKALYLDGTDIRLGDPPAVLTAPGNLKWNETFSSWDSVANASGYSVQLYKDGTEEANKVGEAVSVSEPGYDFSSEIQNAGEGVYYFQVKAVGASGYADSGWAGPSEGWQYPGEQPPAPTYEQLKDNSNNGTCIVVVLKCVEEDGDCYQTQPDIYENTEERQGYSLGEVTWDAGKRKWYCDVTINAEPYVQKYKGGPNHNIAHQLADGEEESKVVRVWYTEGDTNPWRTEDGYQGSQRYVTFQTVHTQISRTVTCEAVSVNPDCVEVAGMVSVEAYEDEFIYYAVSDTENPDMDALSWSIFSDFSGLTQGKTYYFFAMVRANSGTGHLEAYSAPLPVTVPVAHRHVWDTEWSHDSSYHWHECTSAGCDVTDNSRKDSYGPHAGSAATCIAKAVCDTCGEEYGEPDPANHDGGTEVRGAVTATCTQDGYTGDTYCLGCGEKIADGQTIPAVSHSYSTEWTADANKHWRQCKYCSARTDEATHSFKTVSENGVEYQECEICGYNNRKTELSFGMILQTGPNPFIINPRY